MGCGDTVSSLVAIRFLVNFESGCLNSKLNNIMFWLLSCESCIAIWVMKKYWKFCEPWKKRWSDWAGIVIFCGNVALLWRRFICEIPTTLHCDYEFICLLCVLLIKSTMCAGVGGPMEGCIPCGDRGLLKFDFQRFLLMISIRCCLYGTMFWMPVGSIGRPLSVQMGFFKPRGEQ